ncbi:hypothetical protein SteCoe_37395 [Stentor coeruleus]|uniref:Clathrin light chain n=1 Tax=Stentor coeruleus TaxID=5963 RepID=A0A1R2ANF7_9CILI|nr:hypothetical protein SteCoe_37395 [Stentor coeruleus]
MNPLTGGINNSDFGSRGIRPSYSATKSKEGVSSVVFGDNSFNFNSNFIEEERQRRQAEFQRKQESYMKRREANILKDAGRWQAVEEDYKRSLQNLEIKRDQWRAGQKNNPSEAFNVITLDYDQTDKGDYLRKRDEEKKYREGLRMNNLDTKMNSGYNIINGAARQSPLPNRYF